MILIYGGSASGKSVYAEERACALAAHAKQSLLYLATMRPDGAEAHRRIETHRRMRQGKGFETVECARNLPDCFPTVQTYGSPVVLLECMSNLTANEMFSPDAGPDFGETGTRTTELRKGREPDAGMEELPEAEGTNMKMPEERPDRIFQKICSDIRMLERLCTELIIVTNDIFREGTTGDAGTRAYTFLLGRLNHHLAKCCTEAVEVVYGIPVPLKGI